MRRAIRINGIDKELEISKVTAINTDNPDAMMIHLDRLPDGTYRLIYNSFLVPDFKQVTSLEIIREDD